MTIEEAKELRDKALRLAIYTAERLMEPEVLSTLPANRYLDFGTDIFPKMLSSDQTIVGHPITETLIDIGTPDNYKKAQKLAAKRASARIQDVGVIQPVLRRKALEG